MEIAALILSVISLFMSGALLIVFLAKNVFSSHTIQMVPAESLVGSPKSQPMGSEFLEFDAPTAMEAALEARSKAN
jgi:hypothetical protein